MIGNSVKKELKSCSVRDILLKLTHKNVSNISQMNAIAFLVFLYFLVHPLLEQTGKSFFACVLSVIALNTCDQYRIFNFLHILIILTKNDEFFNMNYRFFHYVYKMGTKYPKLFQNLYSVRGKVNYTLG